MKNKTFASIEKVLDILNLFDLEQRELLAIEISDKLNLPLSSTYKYLEVLIKKEFLVRRAGSKKIGLGIKIFRLGNVLAQDFSLVDIALPHLKFLSDEFRETAMLTAIEGQEAIYLEKIEPQRLIKLSPDRGRKLPLHAGASSRVLLAFKENSFIESYIKNNVLKRLSEKTITSSKKLKSELKRIRQLGYCVSESEVDSDAKAIAAPIFDKKKNIVAALTIAGPSERINKPELSKLINLVKAKAREISNDLGYRNKSTHIRDDSYRRTYES